METGVSVSVEDEVEYGSMGEMEKDQRPSLDLMILGYLGRKEYLDCFSIIKKESPVLKSIFGPGSSDSRESVGTQYCGANLEHIYQLWASTATIPIEILKQVIGPFPPRVNESQRRVDDVSPGWKQVLKRGNDFINDFRFMTTTDGRLRRSDELFLKSKRHSGNGVLFGSPRTPSSSASTHWTPMNNNTSKKTRLLVHTAVSASHSNTDSYATVGTEGGNCGAGFDETDYGFDTNTPSTSTNPAGQPLPLPPFHPTPTVINNHTQSQVQQPFSTTPTPNTTSVVGGSKRRKRMEPHHLSSYIQKNNSIPEGMGGMENLSAESNNSFVITVAETLASKIQQESNPSPKALAESYLNQDDGSEQITKLLTLSHGRFGLGESDSMDSNFFSDTFNQQNRSLETPPLPESALLEYSAGGGVLPPTEFSPPKHVSGSPAAPDAPSPARTHISININSPYPDEDDEQPSMFSSLITGLAIDTSEPNERQGGTRDETMTETTLNTSCPQGVLKSVTPTDTATLQSNSHEVSTDKQVTQNNTTAIPPDVTEQSSTERMNQPTTNDTIALPTDTPPNISSSKSRSKSSPQTVLTDESNPRRSKERKRRRATVDLRDKWESEAAVSTAIERLSPSPVKDIETKRRKVRPLIIKISEIPKEAKENNLKPRSVSDGNFMKPTKSSAFEMFVAPSIDIFSGESQDGGGMGFVNLTENDPGVVFIDSGSSSALVTETAEVPPEQLETETEDREGSKTSIPATNTTSPSTPSEETPKRSSAHELSNRVSPSVMNSNNFVEESPFKSIHRDLYMSPSPIKSGHRCTSITPIKSPIHTPEKHPSPKKLPCGDIEIDTNNSAEKDENQNPEPLITEVVESSETILSNPDPDEPGHIKGNVTNKNQETKCAQSKNPFQGVSYLPSSKCMRETLMDSQDPVGTILEIQAKHTYSFPSVPALLTSLQIPKANFYSAVSATLQSHLAEEMEKQKSTTIDGEKLTKIEGLIRKTLPFAHNPQLRHILETCILTLPCISKDCVKEISESETFYQNIPTEVRHKLWKEDPSLFLREAEIEMKGYLQAKEKMYQKPWEEVSSDTPETHNENVKNLVNLVGEDQGLYKILVEWVLSKYMETGERLLCSLRFDLLSDVPERISEDECFRCAELLRKAVFRKHLDKETQTEIVAILQEKKKLGAEGSAFWRELSTIAADVRVELFIGKLIVRYLKKDSVNKDNVSSKLEPLKDILLIFALGCQPPGNLHNPELVATVEQNLLEKIFPYFLPSLVRLVKESPRKFKLISGSTESQFVGMVKSDVVCGSLFVGVVLEEGRRRERGRLTAHCPFLPLLPPPLPFAPHSLHSLLSRLLHLANSSHSSAANDAWFHSEGWRVSVVEEFLLKITHPTTNVKWILLRLLEGMGKHFASTHAQQLLKILHPNTFPKDYQLSANYRQRYENIETQLKSTQSTTPNVPTSKSPWKKTPTDLNINSKKMEQVLMKLHGGGIFA